MEKSRRILFKRFSCLVICAAVGLAVTPAPLYAGGGSGYALNFTGFDSATVPAYPVFNAYPLTLATWIRLTQPNAYNNVFSKFDESALNGWGLMLSNGTLRARYSLNNANYIANTNSLTVGLVTTGVWHHVAFTADATGGKLFLDGVLMDSRSWTGTPGSPTNNLNVTLASSGQMDEMTVWNVARSQAEIQNTMRRSLGGTEAGLQAYYRCDNYLDAFTTLLDSAPAGGANTGSGYLAANFSFFPILPFSPFVETIGASNGTPNILSGIANPEGTNTFVWFEWGATTNYGNATAAQSVGSGTSNTNFSQALTGISGGLTYQFRAVASNNLGVAYGTNQTVATYRCFDFNNIYEAQPPAGSLLFGAASITNGILMLTEALPDQIGSWILDDVNAGATVTGFEARFQLRIGNNLGCCHADGFSFVWARNLPNLAFGEERDAGVATDKFNNLVISNGLIVSFDTYGNSDNDPAPAVDVVYNGLVLIRQTNGFPANIFNTGELFAPVSVKLSTSGLLNVECYSYANGGSLVLVTNLPLPGFSGLAGARFGWGARTGGFSDNHFVDDICLSTIVPCPTPTLAINRSGSTNVVVTFSGTLQSASTPTGSWTNVIGAVSPHVTSSTGQKYFRATSPCNGSP